MRKTIVIAVIAAALAVPGSATAVQVESDTPELCFAQNPVQPTCKITIQSDSTFNAASGVTGAGDWKLVIKRGKKKIVIESCEVGTCLGGPSFPYQKGDVLTGTALTPGSWILAGHD